MEMYLVYLVLANTNGIGVRLFLYTELVLGRRTVARVGYWVNFHGWSASRTAPVWGWLVPAEQLTGNGFLAIPRSHGYEAALRPRRLTCRAVSGRYVNTGLTVWWRQSDFLLRTLQSSGLMTGTCCGIFVRLQRCQPPLNCYLLFKIIAFMSVDNGRDRIASLRAWTRDF